MYQYFVTPNHYRRSAAYQSRESHDRDRPPNVCYVPPMGFTPVNYNPTYEERFGNEYSRGRGPRSTVDDQFKVSVDIAHFSIDDITVCTMDNYIIVNGQHPERNDVEGTISRSFTRRYPLPEGINPYTVTAALRGEVLVISAPWPVHRVQRNVPTTDRTVTATSAGPDVPTGLPGPGSSHDVAIEGTSSSATSGDASIVRPGSSPSRDVASLRPITSPRRDVAIVRPVTNPRRDAPIGRPVTSPSRDVPTRSPAGPTSRS